MLGLQMLKVQLNYLSFFLSGAFQNSERFIKSSLTALSLAYVVSKDTMVSW